ncbi:MAG TPA: H-NS histone family protein [Zeimonas sp.]|nr:H-NS histone family protein [Zeimonas sp.]
MPRKSYEKIRRQIEKLEAQAAKLEAAADEKKKKAVGQVVALMKKLDVTPEDLAEYSPRRGRRRTARKATATARPRKPVPPKYRNAKTGETWSGRGRTPRWLAALEAEGRSREEFRI